MTLLELVLKNLFRKPLRLFLTILPMCLAFIGCSIIIGIHNAYDVELELDDQRRLITINRQSIIQPLMISSIDRLRALNEITDATFVTWFGGHYLKPDQNFSQYAIDGESYFSVYDSIEISDAGQKIWVNEPRSVLVTADLAKRFGWQPGDKITLTTSIWTKKDFSNDWEFIIAGIYNSKEAAEKEVMLIKYKFLERNRLFGRGMTSYFVSKIDERFSVEKSITTIDTLFENSRTPTFTSKESSFAESFRRQLGDLAFMTKIVLTVSILVVFLLTSSSAAQTVVERKRELAIFNAIGYSKIKIGGLLLIEIVLVVLIAMFISTCITLGVSMLLSSLLMGGPFSDIELRFTDIMQIAAIAISLGALSAIIPLSQLLKKDLAANFKAMF